MYICLIITSWSQQIALFIQHCILGKADDDTSILHQVSLYIGLVLVLTKEFPSSPHLNSACPVKSHAAFVGCRKYWNYYLNAHLIGLPNVWLGGGVSWGKMTFTKKTVATVGMLSFGLLNISHCRVLWCDRIDLQYNTTLVFTKVEICLWPHQTLTQ